MGGIKTMSKQEAKIPQVTKEQLQQIEASFIRTYGKSFNRMKKADLAVMVANQSTNYKKIVEQAQYVAKLGLIMSKQRNVFRDILRKRDGLHVPKRTTRRAK